jgi:hypothetical protein
MKTQVNITDDSELILKKIKAIALINHEKAGNKEEQINIAIQWAGKVIDFLDDESFENVIGKKKRL